ncbi:hypothetical protein RIF29_40403 [Crotalaria pallida]|uniref:Uncharacterized protein n=1 Tax=Crotalaria pallida TaxID=3830 RepID=A0AAN9E3U1_CROPI
MNGAEGGDSFPDHEVQVGFNLRGLEMVLLENSKLNLTKEVLECQESEIAVVCSEYEKQEEEMKIASLNLVSQASHMEERKQMKINPSNIAKSFSYESFVLIEIKRKFIPFILFFFSLFLSRNADSAEFFNSQSSS